MPRAKHAWRKGGGGSRGKLKRRADRRFYFKLALRLGKTVAELLRETSSREITEWIAYDRISPIGPERDELRTGILASLVINMTRGKRGGALAKPSDFLLFKPAPTPKQKARTLFASLAHLRKPNDG